MNRLRSIADPQYTRVTIQRGSILAVPMLRAGAPIGAIVITRNEVGPFAEQHTELFKTFADQAGMTIENTRLLKELRLRPTDLGEVLGAADRDITFSHQASAIAKGSETR